MKLSPTNSIFFYFFKLFFECRGPDISEELRQKVNKGSHYAHSGIIEAARELSMQLDNLAEVDDDVMAASDFASIGCSTGLWNTCRFLTTVEGLKVWFCCT